MPRQAGTNVLFFTKTLIEKQGTASKKRLNYYPFGMTMPGRSSNANTYRYAYNGMEQDQELKGQGNSYTTEFRQYDPRLGRWLSIDPLAAQFPWQSPYNGFDDNPVFYTDPSGLAVEDWIKREGSSQWEYDAEITSQEEAEAKYGEGTEFKENGGTYRGNDGKYYQLLDHGRHQEINREQYMEINSYVDGGRITMDYLASFPTNEVFTGIDGNDYFVHAEPGMQEIEEYNYYQFLEDGTWIKIHPESQRQIDDRIAANGAAFDDAMQKTILYTTLTVATTLTGIRAVQLGYSLIKAGMNSASKPGSENLFGKEILRVTTRTGRDGKAAEIVFKDGSKTDISPFRVKSWEPKIDPRAPNGTLQKVKFENAIPGSKGYKRTPTAEEIEYLNTLFR